MFGILTAPPRFSALKYNRHRLKPQFDSTSFFCIAIIKLYFSNGDVRKEINTRSRKTLWFSGLSSVVNLNKRDHGHLREVIGSLLVPLEDLIWRFHWITLITRLTSVPVIINQGRMECRDKPRFAFKLVL